MTEHAVTVRRRASAWITRPRQHWADLAEPAPDPIEVDQPEHAEHWDARCWHEGETR